MAKTSDNATGIRVAAHAPDVSIVLLGKTGSGKSSLGNLLLGRRAFETSTSFSSRTKECKMESADLEDGRLLQIVDTRGTMDTENHQAALDDISNSISLSPDGFNAFILLLRVDTRFTKEEAEAVETAVKIFGRPLYKFTMIVFTRGDQIKNDSNEFSRLISKSEEIPRMHELITMCNCRHFLIDASDEANPEVQKRQIRQIMSGIDSIVKDNGGMKYTHELFNNAKQILEEAKQKEKEMTEAMEEKIRQEMAMKFSMMATFHRFMSELEVEAEKENLQLKYQEAIKKEKRKISEEADRKIRENVGKEFGENQGRKSFCHLL